MWKPGKKDRDVTVRVQETRAEQRQAGLLKKEKYKRQWNLSWWKQTSRCSYGDFGFVKMKMDSFLNPSCEPTKLLFVRPAHSPGPNVLLFFQLALKYDFALFFYTSASCMARNQYSRTSRAVLWRRLAQPHQRPTAQVWLASDHITASSILRSIMKVTQLRLCSSRGSCIFNLIQAKARRKTGGARHEQRL